MQEKIKHMKIEDFSELCKTIETVWKQLGKRLGFDNCELEEIENSGKWNERNIFKWVLGTTKYKIVMLAKRHFKLKQSLMKLKLVNILL